MIVKKGVLYGTTEQGGAHQDGTVFAFDPDTKIESIVYSFAGGTDGAVPAAALVQTGALLYGTSSAGGALGGGTVFSLDLTSKTETVLHSFGADGDGAAPYAPVQKIADTLYGTTSSGGQSYTGTVFKLDIKTHAATVLSTFNNGQSGMSPFGGLTALGGSLYGTTSGGAAKRAAAKCTASILLRAP